MKLILQVGLGRHGSSQSRRIRSIPVPSVCAFATEAPSNFDLGPVYFLKFRFTSGRPHGYLLGPLDFCLLVLLFGAPYFCGPPTVWEEGAKEWASKIIILWPRTEHHSISKDVVLTKKDNSQRTPSPPSKDCASTSASVQLHFKFVCNYTT